ncbi:MAG TPA: DUF4124 domain-containing protein [Gammaproteobacteria bacterium]|nr:DUF4124 domain-containing protein [Gammaproteobacteria bacterium]
MKQIKILAMLLSLLLPIGVVQAQMYKYTDKDGNTVYSQTPPESGDYQSLSAPQPAPPGSNGSDQSDSAASDIQRDAEDQAKQDEVDKLAAKNAQIRQQNCQAAKKNLQVYQVYRRVKDQDGNVVRLTDEERQQKIQEAKDAIKEFCD